MYKIKSFRTIDAVALVTIDGRETLSRCTNNNQYGELIWSKNLLALSFEYVQPVYGSVSMLRSTSETSRSRAEEERTRAKIPTGSSKSREAKVLKGCEGLAGNPRRGLRSRRTPKKVN
ncbi:hypothetical protein Plhal304r1_c043g0123071 [Plasmopara halstedii]